MATGWKTIDGKKYWFDSKGAMATGWKTISNKKYWFNSNGVMATGTRTIGGKQYTFDSNGALKSTTGSGTMLLLPTLETKIQRNSTEQAVLLLTA